MANSTTRTVEVAVDPGEALFDAADEHGHHVHMDLGGKIGRPNGRAVAARDLLLMALAGCSGASFVAELRRRGKVPRALHVTVTGAPATTRPAVFRAIAMHLAVSGDDLDEESLTAAAHACHGDCSVHATLSHVADITTTYEVVGAPLPTGGRS
ncbi:MAG: hypothetical protein GEV28_03850 [Actinophytocola sp.]|uniref:OsmC family protein n=1 Tax=Actinophytocola sp. TaxID=1872138 RepID=UPI00132B731A|nr:OsmC family protein [Actinophytocola sp.]MPZ79566.1 hypothetical protein [Actinophytocola sp.]